ncbi:EI24 domain-containing protein [Nocardioides nanhaiensis]|uniref:EI24 domain-containing protein n=1 Tax=Nocardioides nanhaiensis TaxID=1476871 RepID=A0ABP8WRX5_9ACTN
MTSGPGYLLRGFGLWRTRPRLMLLGMVPAALVFAVLATLILLLAFNLGTVAGWVTPFADDWSAGARDLVRLLAGLVLVVAALAGAVLSFTGLTLAVGDPFYERIWRATEEMLGGPVPDGDLGVWRSVRDGLALVVIGLLTAAAVLLLGFLPVIGSLAGIVAGFLLAARVLARELLGRPLEARGMDRVERETLFKLHRGRVLGFGAVTQLFFLVPFGAVAVMPAAVVGSTMLARDLLAETPPPSAPTAPPTGRV